MSEAEGGGKQTPHDLKAPTQWTEVQSEGNGHRLPTMGNSLGMVRLLGWILPESHRKKVLEGPERLSSDLFLV